MSTRTLPRHALTGITAVGWRKARPGEDPGELYPIWPVRGGDGRDDGDPEDDPDEGDPEDDPDDVDPDKGKDDDEPDHKAEAEKWKAQARKHEQRAKANAAAAKELAKLKREGMSEVEKRIDEAVAAARAEERVKAGVRVARSAFLAAAKGRIPDPKEVVEDINLKKYVDEDGEADDEAIAKLVDKLAPARSDTDDEDDDQDGRDTRRRRRGSGYQGARNGSGRSKSKRGAVSGDELFEELYGRKPKTTAGS
ncbi:hypothetical protein [Streptomyces pini]|uniref:Uncharacterized protein n=1 Tax=Streptomyces pini TaxID=1520580 RepID=A0A1I4BYW1_9ACTN|nr:hypothetical protein [Streptomyces pini]SFK73289.1 hypothetical protein SAMN05192584_108172 [Streptomyces pini]